VLERDELVAAGWPEERIQPGAARNRLHVVLNQLRTFGLKQILQRKGAGWYLSPQTPLLRYSQPP
jgi:hypothetical protein